MNEKVTKPQYYKIALDIASRIAKGELEEGKKLYGRSMMTSEYGVSSETIRRAFKLLSDVRVLEIKPQSCVVILSAKEAEKYVERVEGSPNIQDLNRRLKKLVGKQAALGKEISETVSEVAEIEKKMMASAPFANYEIVVTKGAAVIGKSLQELQFWQSTGATVIAIRRDGEIHLSPGPYALLQENDVVVFIGGSETVQAVTMLIERSTTF